MPDAILMDPAKIGSATARSTLDPLEGFDRFNSSNDLRVSLTTPGNLVSTRPKSLAKDLSNKISERIRHKIVHTFRYIVGVLQSMGGIFERRKANERNHLAELCQIVYRVLDLLGTRTDILPEVDLEDGIA